VNVSAIEGKDFDVLAVHGQGIDDEEIDCDVLLNSSAVVMANDVASVSVWVIDSVVLGMDSFLVTALAAEVMTWN